MPWSLNISFLNLPTFHNKEEKWRVKRRRGEREKKRKKGLISEREKLRGGRRKKGEVKAEEMSGENGEYRIRREESKKHVAKGTDAFVEWNIHDYDTIWGQAWLELILLSLSTQLHCMTIQSCVVVLHMHNTSFVLRFILAGLWLFKKKLGNLASLKECASCPQWKRSVKLLSTLAPKDTVIRWWQYISLINGHYLITNHSELSRNINTSWVPSRIYNTWTPTSCDTEYCPCHSWAMIQN